MIKSFFTKLLIWALIALSGYLFFQNLKLTHENSDLKNAQLASIRSKLKESSIQKMALERKTPKIQPKNPIDWVARAKDHVQKAEEAVREGNITQAQRETRFASLALSRASSQVTNESSKNVAELKSRLASIQAQAHALWHQFGG